MAKKNPSSFMDLSRIPYKQKNKIEQFLISLEKSKKHETSLYSLGHRKKLSKNSMDVIKLEEYLKDTL